MKCVCVEKSQYGWHYTIIAEDKWLFFKSKRKFMSVRHLQSGGYEWMELPNANKVNNDLKLKLDKWVKEKYCS
jgi:hypothetical protein